MCRLACAGSVADASVRSTLIDGTVVFDADSEAGR
jgi:hypothetical protein